MAEAPDQNHSDTDPQQAATSSAFIQMKSVPQRSNARDLRLRDGDVIVAVDGTVCNLDIAEFEDLLLDARDDETPLFVTIARDQMFFEIFVQDRICTQWSYQFNFVWPTLKKRGYNALVFDNLPFVRTLAEQFSISGLRSFHILNRNSYMFDFSHDD